MQSYPKPMENSKLKRFQKASSNIYTGHERTMEEMSQLYPSSTSTSSQSIYNIPLGIQSEPINDPLNQARIQGMPSTHFSDSTLGDPLSQSMQNLSLGYPQGVAPVYYIQPYYAYPPYPCAAPGPPNQGIPYYPPSSQPQQPLFPSQFKDVKGFPSNQAQPFPQFPGQTFSQEQSTQGFPQNNEEFVESIVGPYEKSNCDTKLLEGKIGLLAHFQSGSRYLQKQVEKSNPVFLAFLLKEVTHIFHFNRLKLNLKIL
jgi:hypothetical protein